MNITLFKKYDNIFASDILHSYWVTPIEDASGLFSNWKDFNGYSEEELENLKFDVNPTTISIPNNEIINAYGMFTNNKLIRKVEIDFPNATNIGVMFASSSIEEIECDFSSVNEGNGGAFAKCNKLKTVRCDFRNLEKRVMGAGAAYNDTDGLDRYGYGFSFNASPNLTTCECNFASLKNADNLLNQCSNLTTFNCELDSLESAVGLCTNAVLTLESIDNIAKKIKAHDTAENHRIDLGLNCPTQEDYIFGWCDKINEIKSKNWDVHVYLSTGSTKQELALNGYGDTLNLSGNKILTVSSISTGNNLDYITGNEVSGQKCGFIIVSNDKDIAVNRVAIKTASNYGTTQRNIFLQVRNHNKNIIAKSKVTTLSAPSTEYIFKFDDPFIIEQNTVDSNGNNTKKYYFELYAEGNTSKRAEFNIAFCDVEYGCGALYNSEPSSWNQQWSREDDNHPADSPDPAGDPQRTAWSKFYLEADSKVEEIDLTTVKPKITEIENSIYKQEIKLKLDFSIEDENTTIGNTNILHFKNLETSEILEEAPANITTTLPNDRTIEIILAKKDNIIGNFMGVIEIHGSNNETYYKSFEFDII